MSKPSINSLLSLPRPFVLASRSPRRRALLDHVGFSFTCVDPRVDESSVSTELPPAEYVEHLALLKANEGLKLVSEPSIVLGSDTTVVLDGAVLNKPVDHDDARRMLRALSGNTHTVHTGIAIVSQVGSETAKSVTSRQTKVTFRKLETHEIDAYVSSGSPMDKAGGYGIQDDFGAVFVSRVEGCYYTIVGLPLELLYSSLRRFVSQHFEIEG